MVVLTNNVSERHINTSDIPQLTVNEFFKAFNKDRLLSKDKWRFVSYNVEGKQVKIKSYNCWVQAMTIDDSPRLSNSIYSTATQLKIWLKEIADQYL